MTDKDKILQLTDGGLEVFKHYLGDKIDTIHSFRNPYRQDANASCHLYYHQQNYGGNSRYYLHDFGDSTFHGDCFWLVGNICNIDSHSNFHEILERIDRDLCLNAFSSNSLNAATYKPKVTPLRTIVEKKNLQFWCTPREMTPSDLEFWARYGITKDVLNKYNVTSLKKYTSEKSAFRPGEKNTFSIFPVNDSPLFGYQFNGGTGIKIYHPGSQIRFLYGGVLPDPYVFGLEQLQHDSGIKKDFIYITGGEKDVLSLVSHNFDAVSFNSETYRLTESDIKGFLKDYENVCILYDSDETGIRESSNIVNEFSNLPVIRIQLPLAGTKQEKDISDFFAKGHSSVELKNLTFSALNESKKKTLMNLPQKI